MFFAAGSFCRQDACVDVSLTPENFLVLLKQRIAVLDINAAKQDVEPFLRAAYALNIWSTQYFTQLADMIKFV